MWLNKLLMFFLFFALVGCSSGEEEPEVIIPIELNYPPFISLDYTRTNEELTIINGNGGYKISYPKKMYMDVPFTHEELDFPKDKMRVNIVENTIYIECDFTEDEGWYLAYFLLTDSKDQKLLISVFSFYLGDGPRFDKETEERIKNDPDYWQEN